MPSALLHTVISGLSTDDSDPLRDLATTLPDTLGTKAAKRLQTAAGTHETILEGLRHHHATDRLFHGHPLFQELVTEAQRSFPEESSTDRHLSYWLPHVTTEFLIDRVVLADSSRMSILRRGVSVRRELVGMLGGIIGDPRALHGSYDLLAEFAETFTAQDHLRYATRSIAHLCGTRRDLFPDPNWQSEAWLTEHRPLRAWMEDLADHIAAHRDGIVTDVIAAVRRGITPQAAI